MTSHSVRCIPKVFGSRQGWLCRSPFADSKCLCTFARRQSITRDCPKVTAERVVVTGHKPSSTTTGNAVCLDFGLYVIYDSDEQESVSLDLSRSLPMGRER